MDPKEKKIIAAIFLYLFIVAAVVGYMFYNLDTILPKE
jgi:hypothetical protein